MKNLSQAADLPKLISLKEGDHAAFLDVYNLLHIKIFRFFFKRVLLHDTAKDLTQQCFIRLWQYRHTLSEEHSMEKQVFIIARNLLINHIKKETTRKRLQLLHSQTLGKEMVQPSTAGHFEVSSEVSAAIDTLPPIRKKVIMLKAFYGCSNKEIAAQMSISIKTVEDHVSKAFRHIRQAGGEKLFPQQG
ncbi:MAG: RNA polymerase sigma factor [Chitinophagaceae bacterium]|nr:RNA polymerase sigma factor [Chitinophagaceae bacterium]